MVLVRLFGGLGNQMFQYAAGRALADRLGTQLFLDTRAFEYPLAVRPYTRRAFALSPFELRAKLATGSELRFWSTWIAEVGTRLPFLRPLFRRWYFEPALTYNPRIRKLHQPICLVGYWQSERYFIDIADRIRSDFALRHPLRDANAGLIELASSECSVGLHVRRGDLANLQGAAQSHGLCSIDYYRRAIALVTDHCGKCRFFVFSDDLEWARTALALDSTAVFVTGNADNPEQDLVIMSKCKHHILANSSFSWWAAWLGKSPSQFVVAPSPWYASPKLDSSDLKVSHWQLIDRG